MSYFKRTIPTVWNISRSFVECRTRSRRCWRSSSSRRQKNTRWPAGRGSHYRTRITSSTRDSWTPSVALMLRVLNSRKRPIFHCVRKQFPNGARTSLTFHYFIGTCFHLPVSLFLVSPVVSVLSLPFLISWISFQTSFPFFIIFQFFRYCVCLTCRPAFPRGCVFFLRYNWSRRALFSLLSTLFKPS